MDSGLKRFKALILFGISANLLGQGMDTDESKNSRCASRLAISVTGKLKPSQLLDQDNPQRSAKNLLKSPEFIEYFSRYINAQFNDEPGESAAEDAPYYVMRKVLEENRPYRDLFLGPYRVVATSASEARVDADPNGLGYLRSPAWMERYAGNEEAGWRIVAAYRILSNTLGTELNPTTAAPNVDESAEGRRSPACAVCHYDNWFALDPLAMVLGRAVRDTNNQLNFLPGQESLVLGGVKIANERQLIETLVASEEFQYRSCEIIFEFLYGRKPLACEAGIFDRCMTAFKADGRIQSALLSYLEEGSFCQ